MIVQPIASAPVGAGMSPAELASARMAADSFEAQFIAEMLKYSGLNETSSSFGGGPGEEAFASFLTEAYAEKITTAGGFGLSEAIFRAMISKGEAA